MFETVGRIVFGESRPSVSQTRAWSAPPTFTKAFIPEPDITIYELAEIVSFTGSNGSGLPPRAGLQFTKDVWDSLRAAIKRHFKDVA